TIPSATRPGLLGQRRRPDGSPRPRPRRRAERALLRGRTSCGPHDRPLRDRARERELDRVPPAARLRGRGRGAGLRRRGPAARAAPQAARLSGAEDDQLHDRAPALGRLLCELEDRLVGPSAHDPAHRVRLDAPTRAPVAAGDQATAWRDDTREQALDELAPPLLRRVDELRADEVEPPRRLGLPLERVADEEPILPLGETRACDRHEQCGKVEPVRLDRVRRPGNERLEQVPVRTPDVEEAPGPVDRADDRPPRRLPARLVAAEARLPARVVARQIVLLVDLDRAPHQKAFASRSSLPPRSATTSNDTSRPSR